MKRYCDNYIIDDLKKKMVFLGGPRQVGKTTLSKMLCSSDVNKCLYFNWDVTEDRRAILAKQWLPNTSLIIFDELHKYPRWKQWIKGVYDTKKPEQQYLVTGSARLDVYKRDGDSLMGRYHYWRLHPFTIDEIPKNISVFEAYQRLLEHGGFPEPFLANDIRESRRWRRERFDRILHEDVRDLENIKNIQTLSLFSDALRSRVGSLITLANLAQDLEISPKTCKAWLAIIEKMYIVFAIYPLLNNIPRSILKPPKVYFFDNADVVGAGSDKTNSDGAKLENLVATTLLKRLHFMEDYYGYRCALHYIRDKDGREIDFVVVIENKIEYLIEVKLTDDNISSSLKYYAEKLKPFNEKLRAVQLVGNLKITYEKNNILVTDPITFFTKINPPPWGIAKGEKRSSPQ
jgi:uncharacterized protein